MTTNRVVFPTFRTEQISAYDMRQLVSALELRFQGLESNADSFFPQISSDLDNVYAPLNHQHVVADITDFDENVPSSIFDLDDVSGTPTIGQSIVWDGAGFVPGSAGGSLTLNQLTNVSVPAPADGQGLIYDQGSGQWIAGDLTGLFETSLVDLTDTDLSGQASGDLLYNDNNTWEPTGSNLRWVADQYLELGDSVTLNWLLDATSIVGLEFSRPASSVVADPLALEVSIFLTFDGLTDGQLTVTENSSFAQDSETAGGDTQYETGVTRFGSGSMYQPPVATSQLAFPFTGTSPRYSPEAEDFTFQGWIRFEVGQLPSDSPTGSGGGGGGSFMFGKWTPAGTRREYGFGFNDDDQLEFFWSTTGSNSFAFRSTGISLVADTWYHIAVTREGSTLRLFLNGTQPAYDVGNDAIGTDAIHVSDRSLQIGRFIAAGTNSYIAEGAYLDDVQFVKGTARYTANFTPQQVSFSEGVEVTTPGKFIAGDPGYAYDIDADTTITGTLDVTGAATLSSTLDVTGLATFDGGILANSPVADTTTPILTLATDAINADRRLINFWENNADGFYLQADYSSNSPDNRLVIGSDKPGADSLIFELKENGGFSFDSGNIDYAPVGLSTGTLIMDGVGTLEIGDGAAVQDVRLDILPGANSNATLGLFEGATTFGGKLFGHSIVVDGTTNLFAIKAHNSGSGAAGEDCLTITRDNTVMNITTPAVTLDGNLTVDGTVFTDVIDSQTGGGAILMNNRVQVDREEAFESYLQIGPRDGTLRGDGQNSQLYLTGEDTGVIYGASIGVTNDRLTIQPSTFGGATGITDVFINDALEVAGNLTVGGTTTTINSNTVSIADNIILLNSDEVGAPSQNAGLEIERGTSANVFFQWNETLDRWELDNPTFINGLFTASNFLFEDSQTALMRGEIRNIAGSGNRQTDLHINAQAGEDFYLGVNYTGVAGAFFDNRTTGDFSWRFTGTERMTLDSGGGLTTTALTATRLSNRDAATSFTIYGGPGTDGANIEMYSSTHASVSNDIFYDANAHTFRTVDAASTLAILTTSALDVRAEHIALRSGAPTIWFYETDVAADNQNWYMGALSEAFVGRIYNDAFTTSTEWLNVQRTGSTTVDSIDLSATNVDLNGRVKIDGSSVGGANGSTLTLTASNTQLSLVDSDAAADLKVWNIANTGTQFRLRILDDAWSEVGEAFRINRSASAVTGMQISTDLVIDSDTVGPLLTLGDGVAADNDILLRLNTDRPWSFRQAGNDAGAQLRLYAENAGKEFQVGSAADVDAFRFAPDTGTFTSAGPITATTFNGVALTTGGAATSYLDQTGNYSVPAGAGGGIGGSITDNQIAFGATTADDIEGTSALTFNGTSIVTLTSTVPFFQTAETGVTNNPVWWFGADGGNYSFRLNNAGAYPLQFTTNGTNDAVTSVDINYNLNAAAGVDVTGAIGATGLISSSATTTAFNASAVATGNNILTGPGSMGIERITDQGGTMYYCDSSMILHAGDNFAALSGALGIISTSTEETLFLTADGNITINSGWQSGYASSYRFTFGSGGQFQHFSGELTTNLGIQYAWSGSDLQVNAINSGFGSYDFLIPAGMNFGINGRYNNVGGDGTFGATIWGLDTSFDGGTAGNNSASTSVYGIRWLRSTHTSADSRIGEGLYVYQNGVLEGGIGAGGMLSLGGADIVGALTMNGDINMRDNDEINFGNAAGDPSIYFNGTNLILDGMSPSVNWSFVDGGLTRAQWDLPTALNIYDGAAYRAYNPADTAYAFLSQDATSGRLGSTSGGVTIEDYNIESTSVTPGGTTQTITYSTSNVYSVDLESASGNMTITISGGPASGTFGEMTVRVIQDSATARTVTWAGGTFEWAGGTAHPQTTTLNGFSVYHFMSWDGGTTWFASGADFS